MSVAFLTGSLSRAGAGVFEAARHLASALSSSGRESVVALGLRDAYTSDDGHLWGSVPTRTSSVLGFVRYGYSPRLMRNLAAVDPDVMHLHGLWMYPSRVALSWKRHRSIPLVVTPHGMLDSWALNHHRVKKIVMRWLQEEELLQTADCLHALSDSEAVGFRELGLRQPIFVAPTGAPTIKGELHRAHPVVREDKGKKTLLFLGRIHEKKGIFDLVKVWGKFSVTHPAACDWRLVVAGWGEAADLRRLRFCLDAIPVANRPQFLGAQFDSDKWQLLASADAFILPSLSEGMPVAVLEAWSAGLPVLMTDECRLDVGFQRGAAHRILPGQDGIAAGLGELCGGFFSLDAMRENARRLAAEIFAWDKIAHDTADVYAWLRKEIDRPQCVQLS